MIYHHLYSHEIFLYYACFLLLELFQTYNVENVASQKCPILTTFLLCNLFYFDNGNRTYVQIIIVVYTWYDF